MTEISVRDGQIQAAREAGQASLENEPHAEAAWYASGIVWIRTTTGIHHGVPYQRLQGLQDALPVELEEIEVSPQGVGLRWPQLDVDLTVKGIMSGVYGSKAWMEEVKKQEKVRREQSESQRNRASAPKATISSSSVAQSVPSAVDVQTL